MRGHEALLSMRRRGVSPRWVFIDCGDDAHGLHIDWATETPHRAHVEVSDNDMLSGLDFRFVVGLSVLITGENRGRLDGIAEACAECSAARIVVAHTVVEIDPAADCGFRVLDRSFTDTSEVQDA